MKHNRKRYALIHKDFGCIICHSRWQAIRAADKIAMNAQDEGDDLIIWVQRFRRDKRTGAISFWNVEQEL